jgi:hypothetical protein
MFIIELNGHGFQLNNRRVYGDLANKNGGIVVTQRGRMNYTIGISMEFVKEKP